jgi:hypothetical protein
VYLLAVCLATGAGAPWATAGQTVDGEGFSVELPDGFVAAPSGIASATAEALESALQRGGASLGGTPCMRVHLYNASGSSEAVFVALRFPVKAGKAPLSVDDLDLRGISTAPGSGVDATLHRTTVGLNVAAVTTSFTYSPPGNRGRTSRIVLAPRPNAVFAFCLDAPRESLVDWQAAWDGMMGGLWVDPMASAAWNPLRYATYAFVGLFLVVSVIVLTRRASRPKPGAPWPDAGGACPPRPPPPGPQAVLAPAPFSKSRALDGLPMYRANGAPGGGAVPVPGSRPPSRPLAATTPPVPVSATVQRARGLGPPPSPAPASAAAPPESARPPGGFRIQRNGHFF